METGRVRSRGLLPSRFRPECGCRSGTIAVAPVSSVLNERLLRSGQRESPDSLVVPPRVYVNPTIQLRVAQRYILRKSTLGSCPKEKPLRGEGLPLPASMYPSGQRFHPAIAKPIRSFLPIILLFSLSRPRFMGAHIFFLALMVSAVAATKKTARNILSMVCLNALAPSENPESQGWPRASFAENRDMGSGLQSFRHRSLAPLHEVVSPRVCCTRIATAERPSIPV